MVLKLIDTNSNIKLNIPKFLVDDYPITNGKNDLPYPLNLMDNFNATAFIGRAGSGKTSMLISLLTGNKKDKFFRKRFEKIYLVMPRSSRLSLKKDIFKVLPDDQVYDQLDEAVVDDLIEKISSNSAEGEKSLIIVDDMATHLKKSTYLQNRIKQIIDNRRHLKTCLWITLQTYSSLNLSSRKNISHAFIWKPAKREIECLLDELFEYPKEVALEIMNTAYDKNHSFIFMDVYKRKLFKNLDYEIISNID